MKKNLLKTLFAGAFLTVLTPLTASADVEINETNFPDANFRNYLLRQSYGIDGILTDDEIERITSLYINFMDISSLKGIEHLTALGSLYCYGNQLTTLDLSRNTKLTILYCNGNQLTALDVSKNTELSTLSCEQNQLTTLNVSGCYRLSDFDCSRNQIKGEAMDAFINSLSQRGGNAYLHWYDNKWFDEGNACNKEQIEAAKAKGWSVCLNTNSGWTEFEKLGDWVAINEENFPDEVFRNYMLDRSYAESGVVVTTDIRRIDVGDKDIGSLKGIEYLTSLEYLFCANNHLTELDLSNNIAIEDIYCPNNQLTTLYLPNSETLTSITCENNQLRALDLSKNTTLIVLACGNNFLKELNLSKNTRLESLSCGNNFLTELNVSKNTRISYLHCENNLLVELDVANHQKLYSLDCSDNLLTTLDVSKSDLKDLSCYNNQLVSLDVSNNTALEYFYCYCNQLKGEAMDAFINTLPRGGGRPLYLYDNTKNDEGNVCTRSQVAAIKEKGWIPFYLNAMGRWQEYEGSDDDLSSITKAIIETENATTPVYNLSGQKVTNGKKGIYIVNGKKVVIK